MSFQDLESGRRRKKNKSSSNDDVAKGIFQVTTAMSSFRRLVNSLGTPKDTPTLRHNLHKIANNIIQLAKQTKAKLKLATEAEAVDSNTRTAEAKRIADAKLANDFKAVMEEFQKLQNLALEREMAYAPVIPPNVVPSIYNTSESNVGSDKMPEQQTLLVESKREEVLQLDNEIVFNEAIIAEREHAIEEIQQQVHEVNEIFKDLAVMVHEQGATIEEIDSNIENSAAATSGGKTDLVKASKTQKSNSSLLCILLVIFGILLLIVIIVFAA